MSSMVWRLESYLELLQAADSGVEAVLWEAVGQQVDPCILWSFSVHLLGVHVQLLGGKWRVDIS